MILSLNDVSFTYPGGETPVLQHLNLEIPSGEFTAIIGSNGSGKTSLCRLLTGLIPHFHAGDFSGVGEIAGLSLLGSTVGEIAHRVGFVAQDFENQLLRPRVIDDVGFAPLNFGYSDYKERAQNALESLGIEKLSKRLIWELSGGEKHLVALAGALALDPQIILVDEPVSQLDPLHAEAVYERLKVLNEAGKTIIVIEHFAEFIGRYCSSVCYLQKGQASSLYSVREALTQVETLEVLELAPPVATQIGYRLGLSPLPITAAEAAQVLSTRIQVLEQSGVKPQDCEKYEEKRHALLECRNVVQEFLDLDGYPRTVLRDISFSAYPGDRIALIGANGSGKSTIFRLITGLLRLTGGEIILDSKDVRSTPPEELSEIVSFVYQNPQEMFIEDEVEKDIRYFLDQRKRVDARPRTLELLQRYRLEEYRNRDGRLLSGGQMRRASLAIGEGMEPRILLLDEPSSSLDAGNRKQVVEMLSDAKSQTTCSIIATHDMELAASWANRIIALSEGSILADTYPEDFFSDKELCKKARIREPEAVSISRLLDWNPPALTRDHILSRLGLGL